MHSRSLILLIVTLLVTLLVACQNDKSRDVIGEREMEAILYDYHIAQAIATQQSDSIEYHRYAYIQKVFEKHGITEAQFDTSMVWYSSNSGELFKIYQRLYDRLDAEAAQAGAVRTDDAFASLTADGDTANIWMGQNLLSLQQASPKNNITFAYVADSTFRRGDEYILRGNVRFMQRDGMRDALLALCLHYDGDSVKSAVQSLRGDGEFNIRLTASHNIELKSISGFIYYPTTENRNNGVRRMFVINPMLIRIHHDVEANKEQTKPLKNNAQSDSISKPQPLNTPRNDAPTRLSPIDAPRRN